MCWSNELPNVFVISKGEVFLLSLETGGSAPHPLAEEPTLEIDWRGARLSALKIKGLQIFGPCLAWNIPYGGADGFGDHLHVHNWKTGCALWVRGSWITMAPPHAAVLTNGNRFVGHPNGRHSFVYIYQHFLSRDSIQLVGQ